jgi:hypothetical protein
MTKKNENKKAEVKVDAKVDAKAKTETKTPVKTFTPPRGVDKKVYAEALSTIRLGKKENKTDDEVKALILTGGVPFNKINAIFQKASIDLGYIEDPKAVKENIDKEVASAEIKFDMTREQLDEIAEKITKKIKGATEAKVLSSMRKLFKDNKKKFPAVIREKKGRMGVVNQTLIDVFAKNKEATKKDLFEALKKVTKNEKNASDYTEAWYKVCWALSHGKTSDEALKKVVSN